MAVGFTLAAAVLATGSPLAAAGGVCFVLATLGGYLLSVSVGLFGFREVRTTAGVTAGVLEVAAVATLAALGVSRAGVSRAGVSRAGVSRAGVTALGVVALAMLAAAVVVAPGGAPALATHAGPQTLRAVRIGRLAVLADGAGRTVYWFALDRPGRSACYGSCAAYWPPVAGRLAAGAGVGGRIGVLRRSDGATQATYNGHPLYTYVGDTAPGQARGNGLNLNGGLWHDVVLSR